MELSTKEAAKVLNITPQHMAALCRRKRVEARRVGGKWVITAEALEQFRRTRQVGRPPGRPSKFYNGKSIPVRKATVRKLLAEGKTVAEIAAELETNINTIYRDRAAL